MANIQTSNPYEQDDPNLFEDECTLENPCGECDYCRELDIANIDGDINVPDDEENEPEYIRRMSDRLGGGSY